MARKNESHTADARHLTEPAATTASVRGVQKAGNTNTNGDNQRMKPIDAVKGGQGRNAEDTAGAAIILVLSIAACAIVATASVVQIIQAIC